MRRISAAALLLLLAGSLRAQDFYETRLRSGEAELSASRPVEAADALRIAAFGFLDRPVLLCEALGHLALAEEAAGHKPAADDALHRLADVARSFPACREARMEPDRRRQLDQLARARLPGPSADAIAAPKVHAAGASPAPAAAPAEAPARATAAETKPTPVPAAALEKRSAATSSAPPPAPAAPESSRRISETPLPQAALPTPTAAARALSRPPLTPAPATGAAPRVAPTASAAVATVPSEELDRQPQLKKTTRPAYPSAARERRVGGIVLLRVLVSDRGDPLRVEVARGIQPDLDQAAIEAVRSWQFEPGRKGSVPVNSWTTVAVPFDPSR
jgi:protein TonB